MSKILLTGMTAGHTSKRTNDRNETYAAKLYRALTSAGHEVEWTVPSATWGDYYFDRYDAILLGVAPVLSVTSNHAYGALKAAQTLFFDPRLTLFVDAPVPAQIAASLNAIQVDPTRMVKEFFYKRPFWQWAKGDGFSQLILGIDMMLYQQWPTVIYPNMPWADFKPEWFDWMPEGFEDSAIALNLDGLDNPQVDDYAYNTKIGGHHILDYWVSESMNSAWLNRMMHTLTFGVESMKDGHCRTDELVQEKMISVTGSIIPPSKDGITWWSPRYLHSLEGATPVITEWRDAYRLSPEWGILGSTVEDMGQADRAGLAVHQLDIYLKAIPSHETAVQALESTIRITS